jgi:molybdate transport system regulatory protein
VKPAAPTKSAARLRSHLRLRLLLDEDIAFGPGKADLLEAIAAHGSISAAAKALQMSYRRAWMLVDAMNRCFEPPLVHSAKGGSGGGGAEVTPEGMEVLAAFRRLQRELDQLVEARLSEFEARTRKRRA